MKSKPDHKKTAQNLNEDPDHLSQRLIAYLRDELRDQRITYNSPLTRVQGGFDTLTYRFGLNSSEKALSKPFILRLYRPSRNPDGAVWESAIQNVLAAEGYPAARTYAVCTDTSVLGGAFFVMECLPGGSVTTGDAGTISELLGKAHAELHDIDPVVVTKALGKKNVDAYRYSLDRQFDIFGAKAEKLFWIREAVDWLVQNRPSQPKRLAVCHGDFHWLNILCDKGHITGVLDWPNSVIADPVFDVAMTMMLVSIPMEYVAPMLKIFPEVTDWENVAERYRNAYQKHRRLDVRHLDFYQVEHCVEVLIKGSDGQKIWQEPSIRKGIVDYVRKTTGILIAVPAD